MSEILYQPPQDHKKYFIVSLAILFSLGVIIILILAAKQGSLFSENTNEPVSEQESDEKVLSPEEIQSALSKTGATGDNQDSAIDENQIEDALKKEAAPQLQKDEPQEAVKPLNAEEVQESLNKRL